MMSDYAAEKNLRPGSQLRPLSPMGTHELTALETDRSNQKTRFLSQFAREFRSCSVTAEATSLRPRSALNRLSSEFSIRLERMSRLAQ